MSSPQQYHPAEKTPLNQEDDEFDEVPLGRTAIDPYGRRSMAFRVKKTGQIITSTEMTEARTTDQPERNYFRRMDRAMCFMHWRGFQTKSNIVNNTLLGVATPFLMLYMFGYCPARTAIDTWVFGPPRVEDTADEKAPLKQDADEERPGEEHEPLARTAIDPYGRRSMAFRVTKTGQIITRTEIIEATTTYPPERNWLRRADRGMCFMLFEGVESRAIGTLLWVTCSPLLAIYIMGYCYPRLRMETWMAGPSPPSATNEADEA